MSILEGIANNSSHVDVGRGQYQKIAQVEDNDLMKTMMMTLLERVSSLSTQQVRETLPPLVNDDPNVNVNQFHPQMDDVNYMGRHNGQGGVVGSYSQGRQYQPQGTYQAQGQYNSQVPSYNQGQYHQGQGKFQNPSQQFQGGGSSYNPNARKHENFSYSNPKAAVQFPPGFNPGAKLPIHEGKATNEDALTLILRKMEGIEENGKAMAQHYKSLEGQFTQMSQQQKTMEFQMGQLATTVGNMQKKKYQGPPSPNEHDEEKNEDEIEQGAEDEKDVSEHEEEDEIAPMKEDEE
ncbi:hypothetical protein ACS0TY_022000 [Phlomoides rotata]